MSNKCIVSSIKKEFKDFKIIDADDDFGYLRKGKIGKSQVITFNINRGSFEDCYVKFVVEKPRCRSRLFSGRDTDNTIKRIKTYLKDNKC